MSCPFCQKEHPYSVEEALERLAQGPGQIRQALAGASDRELVAAEPKPGGWSPTQVATHLMDTELIYSTRLRLLLAEEDPALPAFDQNRWASALGGGRELADILQAYELLRKQNVGLVRTAPPGALERSGRHPEYGLLTLRQIVLHLAEHPARRPDSAHPECQPPNGGLSQIGNSGENGLQAISQGTKTKAETSR